MRETWVWSLGWEDPLEKEMATHSSILAWRIPCRVEPGGLQSMGSQRVGHDWVTSLSAFTALLDELLISLAGMCWFKFESSMNSVIHKIFRNGDEYFPPIWYHSSCQRLAITLLIICKTSPIVFFVRAPTGLPCFSLILLYGSSNIWELLLGMVESGRDTEHVKIFLQVTK